MFTRFKQFDFDLNHAIDTLHVINQSINQSIFIWVRQKPIHTRTHTPMHRTQPQCTTRMVQMPATAAIEYVAACCRTKTRTRTKTKIGTI